MINQKTNLLLKVSVLTMVLIFSAIITPCLAAVNSQSPSLEDKTDITFSEYTEKGYIELFGYQSVEIIQSTNTVSSGKVTANNVYKVVKNGSAETMNVVSSFQKRNLPPGSHVYSAKFTSSAGKEYSVMESVLKTYKMNTVTTVATQKITGAFNYSFSTTEIKTIGNVVTKQISTNIQFSNASGKYYHILEAEGTLSSNEAVILDAKATVDQNMIGQSGRYILSFAPATNFSMPSVTNGTWTKCNITRPDGTTMDPWSTDIQIANGGWDGWTRLVGWYWAWTPSEEYWKDIAEWILTGALLLIPAQWKAATTFIALLETMLWSRQGQIPLGEDYASSMLHEGHAITVHYYLIKLWCGFFPYCFESGYCTDQYNGNPFPLGGWWYIPLGETIWSLPPLIPCHPLSNPWPVWSQPEPSPCYLVTVLGHDESTGNSADSNVWIYGDWVGYTGTTYPLPAGTYNIQVESENFHYFDVDGTPVYDNPATFAVTEEAITITAHYYSLSHYVSSIHSCGGPVANPSNVVGPQPDGQFASLVGYGPYQVYGWISGFMNAQTRGHIYVYGDGYGPIYVYISSDGSNWNLVSAPEVTQGSPYWINCGLCLSPFNYIKFVAQDPNDFSEIAIDSVHVEPPTYYNLTISSGAGGSTNPTPGVHVYPETSQVPVTANAGSGYDFDHWLLNGYSYTQNPITVNMDSNHTLQAVFVVGSCDLTVNVLNQYSETGYIPLYIDDQYVGTTGYTYPVTAGNHKIYVESPFFGGSAYHFFQHYYYDSTYNYDNPMTIPITQDKTVTAYYYSTYG